MFNAILVAIVYYGLFIFSFSKALTNIKEGSTWVILWVLMLIILVITEFIYTNTEETEGIRIKYLIPTIVKGDDANV